MTTTTLTIAERAAIRALLTLDKKDRTIDLARARHLSVIRSGHTLDETTAIVTAEGVGIGRTRINVLTKAWAAAPEGVTADEFVTVYVKAATDKNRDEGKARREAAKAAKAAKGDTVTADAVPQGNDTRPVTVTDAVRLIWQLVETFDGDATFVAALTDAARYVSETVAA